LLELAEGRLRVTEKVLVGVSRRRKDAAVAAEVEDLVTNALDFPKVARRLYQSALARIARGELPQPQTAGEVVLSLLRKTAELLNKHRELAVAVREAGFRVRKLSALEQAVAEAERLSRRAATTLPYLDEQAVTAARQGYEQGGFDKLADALENVLAERHLQTVSLPHDHLMRLAETSPPPQSWSVARP
jgi:hypothetical protein